MKLFELSDQIERVMAEAIDHETGEISEEAASLLDSLQLDLEQKALAVAKYAMGEQAEAAAIRAQAAKNVTRAEQHERHATWLIETYLAEHLKRNDMGPQSPEKAGREVVLKDREAQIVFSKSAGAVPLVESHPNHVVPPGTPDSYVTTVQVRKVDKAKIRKHLLTGGKVNGWRLDWRSKLQVK